MNAWLLGIVACAKPPTPAAPLAPPPPVQVVEPRVSGLDGWHLVQVDTEHYWTDLWGERAEALAREALSTGASAERWPDGPPASPDSDLTRRFLALFDAPTRPVLWTWAPPEPVRDPAPVLGPMHPTNPELVAVEVAEDRDGALGLRVWLRPLGDARPALAVTRFLADHPETPVGARQYAHAAIPPTCAGLGIEEVPLHGTTPPPCEGCTRRCASLPLERGRLMATEHPFENPDGGVAGTCVSAMVRQEQGGFSWVKQSCRTDLVGSDELVAEHVAEGMFSSNSGPSLPTAWFGDNTGRWLIVNRFMGSVQDRCLARFPQPDGAIDPVACVRARGDLGGF